VIEPEAAVPAGTTLAAGLIGDPVAHSLSPVIHNAAYAALGLDWSYGLFRVPAGGAAAALAAAGARGLRGLSVTTPHKIACDERSPTVERIGAANTVVFRGGRSCAENTDGVGLLDDLAATWRFDPAGAVCAVVGAGSTARAIVVALADAGAREVLVVDRTPANAAAAAALAGAAGRVARAEEVASAALVVQATSVGFGEARDGFAGGWEAVTGHLGSDQLAVDAVYAPPVTEFLALAGAQGARVRNGLGLLVCQAAHQVALFTGKTAPVEAMFAALGIDPGR